MSRKIIPVFHPQLTSLDLDAFVRQAKALNQQNRDRFTTPFPKHSSRWISHYQFQPRPITFTDKGATEAFAIRLSYKDSHWVFDLKHHQFELSNSRNILIDCRRSLRQANRKLQFALLLSIVLLLVLILVLIKN